jgi:hypothetical protein
MSIIYKPSNEVHYLNLTNFKPLPLMDRISLVYICLHLNQSSKDSVVHPKQDYVSLLHIKEYFH